MKKIEISAKARESIATVTLAAGIVSVAAKLSGVSDASWWLVATPFALLLLASHIRICIGDCEEGEMGDE